MAKEKMGQKIDWTEVHAAVKPSLESFDPIDGGVRGFLEVSEKDIARALQREATPAEIKACYATRIGDNDYGMKVIDRAIDTVAKRKAAGHYQVKARQPRAKTATGVISSRTVQSSAAIPAPMAHSAPSLQMSPETTSAALSGPATAPSSAAAPAAPQPPRIAGAESPVTPAAAQDPIASATQRTIEPRPFSAPRPPGWYPPRPAGVSPLARLQSERGEPKPQPNSPNTGAGDTVTNFNSVKSDLT